MREERHEVVALPDSGAGGELPADAADHAARRLAVAAGVGEIVVDGGARGEAFVPGAQRGERGEVGEVGRDGEPGRSSTDPPRRRSGRGGVHATSLGRQCLPCDKKTYPVPSKRLQWVRDDSLNTQRL